MRWLLLAALVGCGGGAKHVAVVTTPPELTVLDPGAEPRRVVRFDIPLHQPERLEALVDVTTGAGFTNTVLETSSKRTQYPTVRALVTYEALDRGPDGSERIQFSIDRATYEGDILDAKVRAMFDRIMTHLRAVRRTYRMAPSGERTRDVDADAPDGSAPGSPRMSDSLEAITVIFPDQPIGVGAAWTTTTVTTVGKVQMHRTITYHLRALDDASASVEMEDSESAPSQPLVVEPNYSVTVTSATSTGGGQFLYALHGFAVTGGSHGASEMDLSIIKKDLRITTKTQTETELKIHPAAADAR